MMIIVVHNAPCDTVRVVYNPKTEEVTTTYIDKQYPSEFESFSKIMSMEVFLSNLIIDSQHYEHTSVVVKE